MMGEETSPSSHGGGQTPHESKLDELPLQLMESGTRYR